MMSANAAVLAMHMGETRKTYKILVRKSLEKQPLRKLRNSQRITLIWM
jgi:hypothetical protein